MKFLQLFVPILAAPAALAVPTTLNDRQITPVGVITSQVQSVKSVVDTSTAAIRDAINTAKNSIDVGVIATVTTAINANYAAILAALQTATTTITGATVGAVGGLQQAATGLAQAEVDQLTADLQTVQDTLNGLGATIAVTVTDLAPIIRTAVSAEVAAVKSAIEPFVNPVNVFAAAVSKASATATVTVTGLKAAFNNLNTIVQRLVTSLGLPAYTPPSL